MFECLLPTIESIWATNAATAYQSSYAFYYDDARATYLGDEYSIHWMEDSDVENLNTYSLKSQFVLLQKVVLQSQPQLYGQMSMGNQPVGQFQGVTPHARASQVVLPVRQPSSAAVDAALSAPAASMVDSRDVKLALLQKRLDAAATAGDRAKFAALVAAEHAARARTDKTFAHLVALVTGGSNDASLLGFKHLPRDFACLKGACVRVCVFPLASCLSLAPSWR
jgi:legumain